LVVEWVEEPFMAKKPLIYLYPTEETNVEIKLLNDSLLTTTYPKYENSWKVLAYPDGNLIDLKHRQKLIIICLWKLILKLILLLEL